MSEKEISEVRQSVLKLIEPMTEEQLHSVSAFFGKMKQKREQEAD